MKTILGGALLAVLLSSFFVREGFSAEGVTRPSADDASLVSKIRSTGPADVNVDLYVTVLRDFYDSVYVPSADSPTLQAVDAFIGQKDVLRPADKAPMRELILHVFSISPGPAVDREKQQIVFTPDATLLQPQMSTPGVHESSAPGDYVTADPTPVLPDSKKMSQIPTLDRGGSSTNAGAYTWNLAAYQNEDVAGMYKGPMPKPVVPWPVKGVVEGMSTMADAKTTTNEIYGPRVPKMGTKPPSLPSAKPDGSDGRAYPLLYGPAVTGGKVTNGAAGGGSGGGFDKPYPGGSGPLAQGPDADGYIADGIGVPDGITSPPIMFRVPPKVNAEPLPFLNDFSKFFH